MIIKGTTPTIRWTFDVVNPATITTAYLTFKQGCGPDVEKWETVLEKDISGMTSRHSKLKNHFVNTGDSFKNN